MQSLAFLLPQGCLPPVVEFNAANSHRDYVTKKARADLVLQNQFTRNYAKSLSDMLTPSHPKIYNQIGEGYRLQRIPDPRIAKAIRAAIGNSQTVCNIGAGAGSYEPKDLLVTAVEPSAAMIQQRKNTFPVVQASAENLPFENDAFDCSMAVLTIHHWLDPEQGLREMQRVSRRQVILTFDPDMIDSLWLVHDYFPEVIEYDKQRFFSMDKLKELLNNPSIEPVPVPWDCTDGFQAAYWRRPEFYLRREVQNSISTFAQMPASNVERGMKKLAADIESGEWNRRNGNLLDKDEMDFGYRLIVVNRA